ncbi:MAG: hypothetical protein Q4B84_04585 [Clostridia bacterium]|nr:hypothetical protein [Clostridia bacterium]
MKYEPEYRTSVLYDFSIVSKAKFYVFEADVTLTKKLQRPMFKRVSTLDFKDPLPVQINPYEFEVTYGETGKSIVPIENSILSIVDKNAPDCGGIPIIKPKDGRPEPGNISIKLVYDIYDEYNVRTMNGIDPLTDFSLESETHTSLKKLGQIASAGGKYYVLFTWGDMEYFGLIKEVKATYKAFSRWGHALKADADITIENQPLAYDSNTGVQKKPIESGGLGISDANEIRYSEAKDVALVAAQVSLLAASQANR